MWTFAEIPSAFSGDGAAMPSTVLKRIGEGDLPSWYEVTELAVESIGMAGAQLAAYVHDGDAPEGAVQVDRRLASFWFDMITRPIGWELPSPWDSVAGVYRTDDDGWIRLHTNAPHHKARALKVLGCGPDASREQVAEAVTGWTADELEASIVAAKGCAATMRSPAAWAAHPQGVAVAGEPLVAWSNVGEVKSGGGAIDPARPLAGLKVLDLTRVLAGPVATRFLAAYGAHVLRFDPPFWNEPELAPEMTVGKRCARLDLRWADDRELFETRLSEADVLVHGYRSDALAGLGYDPQTIAEINPKLVDVALCAYGWTGPWAQRRGFDSLVQMSSGIADYGMSQSGAETPQPLPVQALDHATGYLIAASVLHGLRTRRLSGKVLRARLSLARTGALLAQRQRDAVHDVLLTEETDDDLAPGVEHTHWGPARRLQFPVRVGEIEPRFDLPAGPLGSGDPNWPQ